MRIAYLYPEILPSKKARGVSVINTSNELSKLTPTTLIIEKGKENNLDAICNFYNIECPRLNIYTLRKKIFFMKSNKFFNFSLSYLLKKTNFSFFYVRHLKTAEFLIKKGKKVVFECHEIFSKSNPNLFKREQFVLKNSLGIVFINSTLKKAIEEYFNISLSPFTIAPGGVNITFPFIKKNFSSIKEIYYVGSLQKWKGVKFLSESMKSLPYLDLKIVGDGEEKNNIPKLSNIHFQGYVPPHEVEKILKNSKITVISNISSPYANFTTPIKLFEYWATSNIVVASDIPTIREFIKDGYNGFLFQTGSHESFKKKIEDILSLPPSKLQEIAFNGYQSAQKFSWRKRAENIFNFLKRLEGG